MVQKKLVDSPVVKKVTPVRTSPRKQMNVDLDLDDLLNEPKKKPSQVELELEINSDKSSDEMILEFTQEYNRSPVKVIPFRAKNMQQAPVLTRDNYDS